MNAHEHEHVDTEGSGDYTLWRTGGDCGVDGFFGFSCGSMDDGLSSSDGWG